MHSFRFARFNTPSSWTEQEKQEFLERAGRRARKAQDAQDEADRCKANARRLILEAQLPELPR